MKDPDDPSRYMRAVTFHPTLIIFGAGRTARHLVNVSGPNRELFNHILGPYYLRLDTSTLSTRTRPAPILRHRTGTNLNPDYLPMDVTSGWVLHPLTLTFNACCPTGSPPAANAPDNRYVRSLNNIHSLGTHFFRDPILPLPLAPADYALSATPVRPV